MLFICSISRLAAAKSSTHRHPAAFNKIPENIRTKATNAKGMATIILITC